jgi:hypothetical protein
MPARHHCLTLLSALLISACQTPTEPTVKPAKDSLANALQLMESQQPLSAKASFEASLNSGSELASQQALAGLCLLYLQAHDIESATTALDAFYLRALRKPQTDTSLKMLGLSLRLNLENSLLLTLERKNSETAEIKLQALSDEIISLRRALQKLRQLSLQ